MFTVVKYGVAALFGASILSFTPGRAASPIPGVETTHDVLAAAQAAVPAAPAGDPILGKTLPQPADSEALVTPQALQQMVELRQAHPRPLRPADACLARTVYLEAANQGLPGQLAVAQVILNRTRTGEFPRSVCAVVNQPGQFATGGEPRDSDHSRPWGVAVAVAAIASEGRVAQVAPGALFFHAAYVRPAWSRTHERIARIGDHIFYR